MTLNYIQSFFIKSIKNLKVNFEYCRDDESGDLIVDFKNLEPELDVILLNANFQVYEGEAKSYLPGRKDPIKIPIYSDMFCCIPLGDKKNRILRVVFDKEHGYRKMLKVEYIIRDYINRSENKTVSFT